MQMQLLMVKGVWWSKTWGTRNLASWPSLLFCRYRHECGIHVGKMHPWSISGIHHETNKRHGRLLPTAPCAYRGSVPWPGDRVAGPHIGGDGLIGSFWCMLRELDIGGTKLDAATLAIWGFKRGRRGAAPKR